jgi:hypothetical protein
VAVDGTRGERKRAERALKDGPLTPEEAGQLLARAARKGSVPALRLWYERVAVDESSRRDADARALLAQVLAASAAFTFALHGSRASWNAAGASWLRPRPGGPRF